MSFKRNFRGCETHAAPATPKYRDNYDRIFGTQTDDEKFDAQLGDLGKPKAVDETVPAGHYVTIPRTILERFRYIETTACALAAYVDRGDEYDNQVTNLIDALDLSRGTRLLKFWEDGEGFVLQDLVAAVRANISWFPRGSAPRTQMEALLARIARFEEEE